MPEATDTTTRTLNADTTQVSDSVVMARKEIKAPWRVSYIDQAPLTGAQRTLYTTSAPDFATGVEPTPLPQRMSNNSGILTLVALMFVLLAFNFRYCIQLFNVLGQELFSVRRRANAFDDPTANETRVIVVLLLVLWVCEGLLLYTGLTISGFISPGAIFTPIGAMIGVALGFYLFQFVAYSVVGYAFTDQIGASQWLKGFNSSQAFLGITLVLPTVVAIFYPVMAVNMIWLGLIFYVLARIVFIFKGFRIFYHNFQSLLYFILYLCALEIVPVILVIGVTAWLAQCLD